MLLELLEAFSNNISVVSSSIIVLNGFCVGFVGRFVLHFLYNCGCVVETTCLLVFPSGLLCCCAGCGLCFLLSGWTVCGDIGRFWFCYLFSQKCKAC